MLTCILYIYVHIYIIAGVTVMTQSREAKNQEKTEVLQNTLNFLVEVDTPFSLRVDIMRVIYIYIYMYICIYTYMHTYIL
jgi:hypothetical protein